MSGFAPDHSRDPSTTGGLAVLTLSDTRTIDNDAGGKLVVELATAAGHRLVERVILLLYPSP